MDTLLVNGRPLTVQAAPDTPLLWVLRDHLGLNGTRYGCGAGLCGACTVHLDGAAARACITPLSAVGGRKVTTIEGLATETGAVGPALQHAWETLNVAQCGYCQPGQLMAACALLKDRPRPSGHAIDEAMSGNLCRCGTYPRIRNAIQQAAVAVQAPRKGGK